MLKKNFEKTTVNSQRSTVDDKSVQNMLSVVRRLLTYKNIFHLIDFVLKKSVLLQSEKLENNFNLNLKNVRNCRNRRATIQSKQR